MENARLSLALAQGAFGGLTGRIAVIRPRAEHDLSALAEHETVIVTGFAPDFAHFKSLGFVAQPEVTGKYDAALVFLPRAKVLARDLIAKAMAATGGGPVLVDGQKTEGIDSILKACRGISGNVDAVISKAHGKIFTLRSGDFTKWNAGGATKNGDGYWTSPGVFSADGVDPGSAALTSVLPDDLTGRVADLGAGWGYLSLQILKSPKVSECYLVEAEHQAVENARQNVADPRARFHWADVVSFQPSERFDHVVTNPPFHTGRAADPDLGRGFITAAGRLLSPQGTLWLVANRHLPYEQTLSATFTSVDQIAAQTGFKVYKASGTGAKPRKTVHRRRR